MNEPSSKPGIPPVRSAYLLGFAVRCMIIAALVFVAFAAAVLLTVNVDIPKSYGEIGTAVDTASSRLVYVIVPAAVICAVLLGAGCAFVAIRATHKIAGPVYRLSADLRRMAAGDYDFVVATRTGDQLKDLAEELETARAQLDGRLAEIQNRAMLLAEVAEARQPSPDDLARNLSSLQNALATEKQQENGS
ncbi:MAG: hypothetical protein HQ592_06310 [Planctomycetes bacterium]|nr:hypothetical protein [Planctomycetota bacterium]